MRSSPTKLRSLAVPEIVWLLPLRTNVCGSVCYWSTQSWNGCCQSWRIMRTFGKRACKRYVFYYFNAYSYFMHAEGHFGAAAVRGLGIVIAGWAIVCVPKINMCVFWLGQVGVYVLVAHGSSFRNRQFSITEHLCLRGHDKWTLWLFWHSSQRWRMVRPSRYTLCAQPWVNA